MGFNAIERKCCQEQLALNYKPDWMDAFLKAGRKAGQEQAMSSDIRFQNLTLLKLVVKRSSFVSLSLRRGT